jgi:hypothetical protein
MLHCKTLSIYCVIKTYYIYIQLRNINLLELFDEIDSKYGLRVIFLSLLLAPHLTTKVKIYADKEISFDGDPSHDNSFVCERVFLIFLLQHWSYA